MLATMASTGTILYLVHLDIDVAAHPDPSPDLVELSPGLYLTESARTRSQVYHAIKRRFSPRRLLVAPRAHSPAQQTARTSACGTARGMPR